MPAALLRYTFEVIETSTSTDFFLAFFLQVAVEDSRHTQVGLRVEEDSNASLILINIILINFWLICNFFLILHDFLIFIPKKAGLMVMPICADTRCGRGGYVIPLKKRERAKLKEMKLFRQFINLIFHFLVLGDGGN